ncbi:MAG: hypothetical protein D6797_05850 [Bdellovibrio sp.]|nr:MAG: hypothetical protein D6797_05850 [Bdellovibrio sp.]
MLLLKTVSVPFILKVKVHNPQVIEDFLKQLAQDQKLPPPEVTFTPYLQVLYSSPEEEFYERWKDLYQPFGLIFTPRKKLLAKKSVISIKVQIAEVGKKAQQTMGLDWSKSSFIWPLDQSSQLITTLQAMENKGWMQLLSQPQLLCESGKKAYFHSGGSFPIKIQNYRTKTVIWKNHGLLLEIEPKSDAYGNIQVHVSAEISLIDSALSADGIPSLKRNRVETFVNVKSGQTIILSGLSSKQWGHNADGLPFLMRLPLIGRLFGSFQNLNKKNNLIIFITPSLVTRPYTISNPEGWVHYE